MRHRSIAAAMLAAVLGVLWTWAGPPPRAAAATIIGIDELSPTRSTLSVDSPAMGRVIQVQVLHPAGGGARPS